MTYTKDLLQLIRCSGYAGTAGQSFRNNVAGPSSPLPSGTKMSDYIFNDWNWTGGIPSQPDSGVRYNSGAVFNMTGSMSCNANAQYIIRQGTNSGIITASYAIQAEGDNVQVTADSVSSTAMSASVLVTGQVNPGLFPLGANSVSGLAHYWINGADSDTQPADNNPCTAHFHAAPVATAPDGGYLDMSWQMQILNINTNSGLFNSDPTPFTCTARVNNRGLSASDFTFYWYTDSGYSSLYGTGPDQFWDESFVPEDFSLWLAYTFQGGSQIQHGQVTFHDQRSAQ